jgi:nucleoside-diphosphate-sugar epimerase
MTRNLLDGCVGRLQVAVLLSSVAVYESDGAATPLTAVRWIDPLDDYGRSKVECEAIFWLAPAERTVVLRLTPVFDGDHLADVRKRVFMPRGTGMKVRLFPTPSYSMCRIDTALAAVCQSLEDKDLKSGTFHVAEASPFTQHALAELFPGWAFPVPVHAAIPLYTLLRLVPGVTGRRVRCLFRKLILGAQYQPVFPRAWIYGSPALTQKRGSV